jgi:hypothetical protein
MQKACGPEIEGRHQIPAICHPAAVVFSRPRSASVDFHIVDSQILDERSGACRSAGEE